jgi:fumarate reductase flavoprotein subunit
MAYPQAIPSSERAKGEEPGTQRFSGRIGDNLTLSLQQTGVPERHGREYVGILSRAIDLAGGLVEVVPTAHYMMGGFEFAPDCTTTLPGLFVAGEDSGGVHGANRLGGNGVANSTVFGAVAGDAMAAWVRDQGYREPDRATIEAALAACERPFNNRKAMNIEAVRAALYELMWEKVGIIRDAAGLQSAQGELAALDAELDAASVTPQRAFNLTWHDWLNLKSLVAVSRAIAAAAMARRDSRGAHFRSDYPESGALESSAFTSFQNDKVSMKPVSFTRVAPGQTLLRHVA